MEAETLVADKTMEMQKLIDKAEVLIEALPYIRSFFEKIIIIKYGGSAMLDPTIRRSVLQDIVFMNYVGMRPILVHGGGPFISKQLQEKGLPIQFVQGFRVTSDQVMDVVEDELTRINREIVQEIISLGGSSISLSGKDDHLIMAKKHEDIDGIDIGYVGEVEKVNATVLEKLVTSDIIPVIAPIGIGKDGYAYNINADIAAAEIARTLKALKFVLLTDTPGILRDAKDPETLISQVKVVEAEELIGTGVVHGGMIPKLKSCLRAMDRGVKKAHIISGKVPHALLLEIFTDKGIGTEIVKRA